MESSRSAFASISLAVGLYAVGASALISTSDSVEWVTTLLDESSVREASSEGGTDVTSCSGASVVSEVRKYSRLDVFSAAGLGGMIRPLYESAMIKGELKDTFMEFTSYRQDWLFLRVLCAWSRAVSFVNCHSLRRGIPAAYLRSKPCFTLNIQILFKIQLL